MRMNKFLSKIFFFSKKANDSDLIETSKNSLYLSLSPTSNADDDGVYNEALLWALKNKKKEDIKNIALTGPYGSGKSSIIKTFIRNNDGREFKFLNISLATFKEESVEEGEKEGLVRLIELSILQQIFYHEKDSKIPDSRFRKIKSFSKRKAILISSLIFLLLFSLITNYSQTYLKRSLDRIIATRMKAYFII